jgi:hypothetical protein
MKKRYKGPIELTADKIERIRKLFGTDDAPAPPTPPTEEQVEASHRFDWLVETFCKPFDKKDPDPS